MPVTINGTTGIAGVDGSNTTPAIKGGTSTGTGVFYGTNTVSLATGGTTAVTVDASQNVGIGTSSPTDSGGYGKALDVAGTNGSAIYAGQANGVGARALFAAYNNAGTTFATIGTLAGGGYVSFLSAGAERARIDSSGNVGIGTTSPQARFHSKAGATSQAGIFEAANSVALLSFVGSSTSSYTRVQIGADVNDMVFYTTGSERARIDSSGNLMVNTTSAIGASKFSVSADTTTQNPMALANTRTTAATDYSLLFYRAGSIVGSIQTSLTATSYVQSSDISLKENIQYADSALVSILSIPIRQWDWKSDGSHTDYGLVAQEADKSAPEIVCKQELWGVDYGRITPRLIKAFQELSAKLDAAEARIAALEAK